MAHSRSHVSDYWLFIATDANKYWGPTGENMSLGYDIFRELNDGHPLWIAQAATLEEAQEKLATLARTVPAKYFIRDATTAKIVESAEPKVDGEAKY